MAQMFADGKLCPAVGARYSLDEAPRALRDLADRNVIGKAVLTNAL